MTPKSPVCREIETDLIAAATGEADAGAERRVREHVARCASCRDDFGGYRAVDRTVGSLRTSAEAEAAAEVARVRLLARLADLRTRLLTYGVFSSPLGPILIARSEHGVSLVEYLDRGGVAGSRLARETSLEVEEDSADLERVHRELLDYLKGRRTHLEWPLDLRLARSDFHREVLGATAAVPYGTVTSYVGIATEIGQPRAVRAVAQALRHNPVPIVVPCHRIIGVSGDLTGYAGKQAGAQGAVARGRGRTHGARRRRATRGAPRAVPLRRERRARILRADLRLDRASSHRARYAARLSRAGRGPRPRPLHQLPAGSPPAAAGVAPPFHHRLSRSLRPGIIRERGGIDDDDARASDVVRGGIPPDDGGHRGGDRGAVRGGPLDCGPASGAHAARAAAARQGGGVMDLNDYVIDTLVRQRLDDLRAEAHRVTPRHGSARITGSGCPHRRTELPDGLAPDDLMAKGGEARELAAGAQRRSRSDHDPRSR
jgi:methylated-DNA-[protein]-cysteine S-methyltransferase